MQFSFTGNAKFLTPQLRLAVSQLLSRGTCKIGVSVDREVATKLESNEVKPRQHPGIVKAHNIQLPLRINEALQRVIGDHPVKTLLKDCKRLNKYIQSRHPPPEQNELSNRIHNITDEVDKRMPSPEQLELLGEEKVAQLERKRENAVRRILAQRTYAWKPITYGAYEALVYAIGRSAQEYSVLVRILSELQLRDPHFQPRSYFDFGSGIGTGMWAVSSFWRDTIYEYFNVDSSRNMHDLSELLLRDGNENQQLTLRNVYYRQFLPAIETKYDLVLSSFSLFELPSSQHRKEVIFNLWSKCEGYLIIAEEGSRRGAELVNEAREYLLGLDDENLKGHVLAPCSHDLACPRIANIEDRTPCNFEVCYSPLQVGEVNVSSLTTRFSYVVLKKGSLEDPTRQWPRLVRPTLLRSKHAICRMCTADAKLQEIIFTKSKHGKTAYKCAKVSRWGDRLPIDVGETYQTETTYSKTKKEQQSKNNVEYVEAT